MPPLRARSLSLLLSLSLGLLLAGCPKSEPPPSACGEVTAFGQCDGQTLSYCFGGSVVEQECARRFGSEAICFEVAPSWGYDCGVPLGAPCLWESPDGEGTLVAFCDGEDAGCYLAAGEAYCRAGLFSCTDADERTCRGETAVLYCFADQPVVLACDDWGARCEAGECVGVEEGGFCTEPLIRCAAGLSCSAEGRCVDTSRDAGMPEDGGEPACVVPGDLVLRSAADLLAFRDSGCVEVLGDVRVESTPLADLSGLEALERIGGDLLLLSNGGLLDVRGLSGLLEVGGGLTVQGNGALRDLGGLTNLERIGGELRVVDDAGLLSLSGLGRLGSVGGALFLAELPLFEDLGLGALTSVEGELGLYALPALRSARFGALRDVGGTLVLSSNTALADLNLGTLSSLGGDLRAVGNSALSTCLLMDLSAALRASGWSGIEEIRDNGPCP